MDERLDAILTEYEDAWRAAALRGEAGYGDGGEHCALSLSMPTYHRLRDRPQDKWTGPCPACGAETRHVTSLATHLYDQHGWRWLDFANKFRDALAQGRTR